MRDLASGINVDQLPSGDTSIALTLTDIKGSPTGYVHVHGNDVEVCDTDLGHEIDVYIESTLDVMTRIWYGEVDMSTAMQDGRMRVDAAPIYTRKIKHWLKISSFTTDHPQLVHA
jgi:putative sterol carrier protein